MIFSRISNFDLKNRDDFHSRDKLCPFNSFMTEADIIKKTSTDLQSKSTDWFLYDIGLRHERVKMNHREEFETQH